MSYKLSGILFFALISCATGFGQSSFQEITPGTSTRNDVARVFGQPVRAISATLFEYNPPSGIARVEVEYAGSSVVRRIEVYFVIPVSRSALINRFNLSPHAESMNSNPAGRLMEYFGDSALLVLTYAAADANSGVNSIGYYSRELFDDTSAKAGRRQSPGTQAGASQNLGAAALGEMNLPEYMRPPAGNTWATAGRSGRTSTSGGNSTPAHSSETKRTTATKRSDPSSGGRSPMTMTTRSDDGLDIRASNHAGANRSNDADSVEVEIDLSADELRRLVGRYEFTEAREPGLKLAVVGLAGGKLKLTMGSVSGILVPIAEDDFVVGDQGEGEVVRFKVAGRPGVKVYFHLTGDKIERLFMIEHRRQPKRFSFAIPKP
jgi:hypothetical protein